jgi:hypothetical protein
MREQEIADQENKIFLSKKLLPYPEGFGPLNRPITRGIIVNKQDCRSTCDGTVAVNKVVGHECRPAADATNNSAKDN